MFYSHVIDDALESKVGKSGLPRASLDRELARASLRSTSSASGRPMARCRCSACRAPGTTSPC